MRGKRDVSWICEHRGQGGQERPSLPRWAGQEAWTARPWERYTDTFHILIYLHSCMISVDYIRIDCLIPNLLIFFFPGVLTRTARPWPPGVNASPHFTKVWSDQPPRNPLIHLALGTPPLTLFSHQSIINHALLNNISSASISWIFMEILVFTVLPAPGPADTYNTHIILPQYVPLIFPIFLKHLTKYPIL